MKIAITSDIHLGDSDSRLDPNCSGYNKGHLFYKFVDLLYNHSPRGPVDYLILNGDILDFSINSFTKSCNIAKKFFREIKKTEKEGQSIVKQIIYIPGNHDKHIWDAVEWEVNVIRKLKKHKDTRAFKRTQPGIIDLSTNSKDKNLLLPGVRYVEGENRYGDLFLEGLFEDENNKLPINIVYPNLYIKVNDCIYIITHGHMFDTPWVLLSELLDGWENIKCGEIQHFEEYNYPLTSMICTGVGQGGDVSNLLYKILTDIRRDKNTKNLEQMIGYMLSRLPIIFGKNLSLIKSKKLNTFISKIIIWYLLRKKGIENPRNNELFPDTENNPAQKERLKRFYEASLKQLEHILAKTDKNIDENKEYKSCGCNNHNFGVDKNIDKNKEYKSEREFKTVGIIFGHTHVANKKFSRLLDTVHLDLYNTGGWLKSTKEGVEIFFFDNDGNLTSENINKFSE